MAEFETTIKLDFSDDKLNTKIDKIIADYFKGKMTPELNKILKKALFLKSKPAKQTSLKNFRNKNAGLFTKLLLEDMKNENAIVTYNEEAEKESLSITVELSKEEQKQFINYPDDLILKKIAKLDDNESKKKFNVAIEKGDFEE